MVNLANERDFKTATIANAASLSDAIDLEGYRIASIDTPVAWTAAALTFSVSNDGTNYYDLFDDAATEVSVPSASIPTAAVRAIVPSTTLANQLLAHRWMKLRSGTTGTPVNQGAQRLINLALVPY